MPVVQLMSELDLFPPASTSIMLPNKNAFHCPIFLITSDARIIIMTVPTEIIAMGIVARL
jgi:hypothetical protein